MSEGNNGGYANDWLVADRNTGEVASLELGLKNVNLQRTKDGYFAGSNYPIDPKLNREEAVGFDVNDMSLSPNARRARWRQLIEENKGRIDVAMAQRFLADHFDTYTKKEDPRRAHVGRPHRPFAAGLRAVAAALRHRRARCRIRRPMQPWPGG